MVQFLWAVVAVTLAAWPLAAAAACVKIRTVTDLDNVRNNLAGSYCLAKDIDASSVANFTPIGSLATPFTGALDGRGHVIRGLTIDSVLFNTGLFGVIGSGGVVKNLSLLGVNMNATNVNARIGALAGTSAGSLIRSHVTGAVQSTGNGTAGGLVGTASDGSITQSSSAASVTSLGASNLGGLVGDNSNVPITLSHSTGPVHGGDNSRVGGLVGSNIDAAVTRSFAAGTVQGGDNSDVGGLIGIAGGGTALLQTFATGPVNGTTVVSRVGGLVGNASPFGGTIAITQSYAVGRVSGQPGSTLGGLIGAASGSTTVTKSYWDKQTTAQPASAGGRRRTTAQLQGGLPNGFSPTKWSFTPGVSYPFLAAGLTFDAPLAITVFGNRIYTFLPISQLDPSQYLTPPAHGDEASAAAVFTMLARAIGVAKNVASLIDVPIDGFFWDDAAQKAFFRGPVKKHATPGPLVAIPGAEPISDANVIGPLKQRKVVAIRGKFQKAGGETGNHWMLATAFTVDGGGDIAALIADDPWTGQQVRIDPVTKTVASPANFPLASFKVNRFQVIALN